MSEPSGFRAFYERETPGLRRLAFRLTGDGHQADELTQDAMERCYRAWSRITEHPDRYARASLLNAHRSRLRRRWRERRAPLQPGTAAHLDHPRELWDEIMRLPIRQRQAIVLHFYEDLPQTEIAMLLGCASGTVNSLVFRALERLRGRFEDRTIDDRRGA